MDFLLKKVLIITVLSSAVCLNKFYDSFDIREKGMTFQLAYFPGYYSDKDETCNVHLPIQIVTFIYERFNLKAQLSPMTIISCLKIECKDVPVSVDDYNKLINNIFENIEEKGLLFLSNAPYKIPDPSTYTCDFKPDIEPGKISFKPVVEEVLKPETFDKLRAEIFQKGSVLGYIQASPNFLTFKGSIYNLAVDKLRIYAIRIIGWRVLKNELYWVFSFAADNNFCILSFCMIKAGAYNLNVVYEAPKSKS